ncbi:helix-turn-helix domain-containing protein [Virgibacillus proomii]|uniref:helix-turn-helix domain-containing protein n=1 Tax=Virgibacillus proomii TaxID=84407 RepID=UPI001C11E26B|nr:helix-turn-helix domain-containing protein [Virgibacillus proomii]MBU5265386.1 helix-turn-helix domain-containing protein [Virgibacillus proomii]
MILEGIILSCLSKLQTERSISAVYHIVTGKKSIQTVQDIHLYHLQAYFSVCQHLPKSQFDQMITDLTEQEMIREINHDEQVYMLTKHGSLWLNKNKPSLYLTWFHGLQYSSTARLFSDRLHLIIQTATNAKMSYFQFIPVVENPQVEHWVKKQYQKIKPSLELFLSNLYQELYKLLCDFPDKLAKLFVERLTSYKDYGKSIYQLAGDYQISAIDVQLLLTAIIHQMIQRIKANRDHFPILTKVIVDLVTSQITVSAQTTDQLLKTGYSIEEIAEKRRLRVNTIYDHVVEIALYEEDFPINQYVSDVDYHLVIDALKIVRSYKLKLIKELVPSHISFFQIRLVLAVEQKLEALKLGDEAIF